VFEVGLVGQLIFIEKEFVGRTGEESGGQGVGNGEGEELIR
jgi:hypothetical protein